MDDSGTEAASRLSTRSRARGLEFIELGAVAGAGLGIWLSSSAHTHHHAGVIQMATSASIGLLLGAFASLMVLLAIQAVDGRPIPEGRSGPPTRAVSERVRFEVWRRDEGHCVDCGSRERLEFDHIVPVGRGGSDTAGNLVLRCEVCNRAKRARV